MFEKEIEKLKKQERFDIEDLRAIIKILRSENGCPWDREQTHESIIPGFIEETYEVVEAIEAKNPDMLREELGDVLLQIVFHCQIEEEQGGMCFNDAVTDVCRKMIVRHPHVFGDVVADTSEEVLKNWDIFIIHIYTFNWSSFFIILIGHNGSNISISIIFNSLYTITVSIILILVKIHHISRTI